MKLLRRCVAVRSISTGGFLAGTGVCLFHDTTLATPFCQSWQTRSASSEAQLRQAMANQALFVLIPSHDYLTFGCIDANPLIAQSLLSKTGNSASRSLPKQ